MGRYPLDVLHQGRRIAEYGVVDPLDDIANRGSALIEDRTVGVVDVPAAIGFPPGEVPRYLEGVGNLAQVVLHRPFHSLSG